MGNTIRNDSERDKKKTMIEVPMRQSMASPMSKLQRKVKIAQKKHRVLEDYNDGRGQYKIVRFVEDKNVGWSGWLRGCGLFFCLESDSSTSKSGMITRYLNWSFRVSFTSFLLSAIVIFISLNFVFTLLVYLSRLSQPECLYSDNINDITADFTLAWTSFTTVGYGNIYPRYENDCLPLNFLTSLAAFVGVIYAGFCGAVMFGKVQSIHKSANIIFSQGCVIRFGEGLGSTNFSGVDPTNDHAFCANASLIETTTSTSTKTTPSALTSSSTGTMSSISRSMVAHLPFPEMGSSGGNNPVLVFRIVNEYYNVEMASIRNLSLNCAAVVEVPYPEEVLEGNPNLVPRRFYPTLQVTPSTLPLFERVAYVRHELNQHSPLLLKETRELIRQNGGEWPHTYTSSAISVEEQLDFIQILVSLEGTSNINKESVYSEKIYERDQIIIGYRFVGMTFKKDSSNELYLDMELINVVEAQNKCDTRSQSMVG